MSGFLDAVPCTPGAAAVAVTAAGNAPSGAVLINRGDHGGTVWVRSGPAGPALPLTPGGSLQWTDTAALPYVQLDPAATATETVIVTNQVAGFANPEAVAAATAAQLSASGIPSVLQTTTVYTGAIPAGVNGTILDVGQYASLVISPRWGAAGPQVLALYAFLPDGSTLPVGLITVDTTTEDPGTMWVLPVIGAQLKLMLLGATTATVSVMGSNRPVPRFRQIGQLTDGGAHQLFVTCSTTAKVDVPGRNGAANHTAFNGNVTVLVRGPGAVTNIAGTLFMNYVDQSGAVVTVPYPVAQNGVLTLGHPSVPVTWSFQPSAAVAGNTLTMIVTAANG